MNNQDACCSSGPVSTLPGTVTIAVQGAICDMCEQPATRRVQGETDSIGCEYHHYCDDHYQQYLHETTQNPTIGECDWCRRPGLVLKPIRDFDEGLSGPVYEVCCDCRRRQNESLREELSECNDDFPEFDDE